jgi:hypothetical protein
MTERTRRIRAAQGGRRVAGLVTATLMAENLVLALAAAAVGLVAGGWPPRCTMTNPGAA